MSFLQALSVQGRVISALTLRETRSRYGNSKLGFFWALFEPFAHIMIFIGIFSALSRGSPVGESTGLFILTGIAPWLLFNNIVNKVMVGIQANKSLMGYPQVMPLDVSVSRVILETATMFLVTFIFLMFAILIGVDINIDYFPQMIAPIGLLIILSMGVGLINASIIQKFPSYSSIYGALSRPLYFMSGVFFTADFFSPEMYTYLSYNPILHILEWYRSGFYTEFNSNLYSESYVIKASLIALAIGLLTDRISSKQSRQI